MKTEAELKDALIEALRVLKMIDNLYRLADSHNLSIKYAIQKAETALKEINPDEDVPAEETTAEEDD